MRFAFIFRIMMYKSVPDNGELVKRRFQPLSRAFCTSLVGNPKRGSVSAGKKALESLYLMTTAEKNKEKKKSCTTRNVDEIQA